MDQQHLLANTWITTVEHHAELSSTQDRARTAAAQLPLDVSLLVVADQQTQGRGRGSNRWWTGAGSLAFSLLFDPAQFGLPRGPRPEISLVVGLAVIEVVEPLLPERIVGLHWPNDVYVGSRKLAGILIDMLPDGRLIAGVGLNSNNTLADAPAELREQVTTLLDLTDRTHEPTELLIHFAQALAAGLSLLAKSPVELGRQFDLRCLQHGHSLTLRNGDQAITGICTGIATDGALLLDTDTGRRVCYSGTLR